jgi:hypothetical protein
VELSQNKKISMKTNDKNSLDTKTANRLIAEIQESIEQIKIQLSEIRKSDNSYPKLYAISAEIFHAERALERFEDQLAILSNVFA